jgi:hypothetical protein
MTNEEKEQMTTQKAVDHLTKELKADMGYFYAWQANIAMAFQDECVREGIRFPQLHKISNDAAINFLNMLCNRYTQTEGKE